MAVEDLEARIRVLENQVRTLQDIEAIKRLQRSYGYYLEHFMANELVDLWSDSPEATLLIALGEFKGKEALRRYFRSDPEIVKERRLNPAFRQECMQLSGIVTVDPDGKSAKGRWYGLGLNAWTNADETGRTKIRWHHGIYEADYIKEDGIWKFLKLHWCMEFQVPWGHPDYIDNSWDPERLPPGYVGRVDDYRTGPGETRGFYPSAFIFPFHFKHPVTGKVTSERDTNP